MTKNQTHTETERERDRGGLTGEWGDTLAKIADLLHTSRWNANTCDRIAGELRAQGFHVRLRSEKGGMS